MNNSVVSSSKIGTFNPAALKFLAFVVAALCAATIADAGSEWSRFRGPDGQGLAPDIEMPTEWSADDYEWVRPMPGVGHSSPVVHNGRLYLTSGLANGERQLLCLDSASGSEVWTSTVEMQPSHLHKKNSYGSCTPVVGPEGIFAIFTDGVKNLVIGFDFKGDESWRRDLGSFESQHGQGSSAILFEGMVIVPNDQMGESFVVALDAVTGDEVWRTSKREGKTAYATPMIATFDGHDVLLVLSESEGVSGFSPRTGERLFTSGSVPLRVVASPVIADGAVIVSCGSGGRGKHMEAVVPSFDKGRWTTNIRWARKRMLPYVPTPVVRNGLLFLWNDDGTVACVRPADGSEVWKERIGGNFSSSPVLLGDKIVAVSEDGVIEMIDANEKFRRHPGGKIDDLSYASPAVSNDRIYFRGFSSLSCLPTR